jgi:putative ABC transport system ATP-binding protein
LVYTGMPARQRRQRAMEMLHLLGLENRARHLPNQLSGGQQQRVAIARALINHPQVLLADEPTGNLDSQTSEEIMAELQRLNRELGQTIMLVTHEHDIASHAGRLVLMRDGLVARDVANPHPRQARVPMQTTSDAAPDDRLHPVNLLVH